MPIGPHKKSTASMTRCQFLRAVPLEDFFVLRSFRDSCRGVWLPRARGGGHVSELGRGLLVGAEECSSMLVSDWFTVDERRETSAVAERSLYVRTFTVQCFTRLQRRRDPARKCRSNALHRYAPKRVSHTHIRVDR